jgi:hypothetical protein
MSIRLFVSKRAKPDTTARPLSVGCLIFEQMDQIDFTGPFEILSRMPDTTVQIIGKGPSPVRDVQGLLLSPGMSVAEAGYLTCYLYPVVMGSRRSCTTRKCLGSFANISLRKGSCFPSALEPCCAVRLVFSWEDK